MKVEEMLKIETRYLQGKLLAENASRKNAKNLGKLLQWEWSHWTSTYTNGCCGYDATDGTIQPEYDENHGYLDFAIGESEQVRMAQLTGTTGRRC